MGVTGYRVGSEEGMVASEVEAEAEGDADAEGLIFSACMSASDMPMGAWAMSEEFGPMPIESPEVIIDSELTEGLAGEKIRVTLEGEAELEALGVTAAAAMLEVEVGVMVGKLGILEDEDIIVALIDADEAEEAVIDIL